MALIRAVARPMLASMFVLGGWGVWKNPASRVPLAEKVVGKLTDLVPLPVSTEQIVKVDAAVKVAAGAALGLGIMPRLAALTLAASLAPTTVAGHAFWEETDPAKRVQQRTHFFKNVSMLGGLLLAASEPPR